MPAFITCMQQPGKTALIDAAKHGNSQAFEQLLAAGNDPYATDATGLNAIDHAILQGTWARLKNAFKNGRQPFIDQRRNIYPQLTQQAPKVPKATGEEKSEHDWRCEIEDYLIARRPRTNMALSFALSHNLPDLAIRAINQNADIEASDVEGRTPLIRAAQHGHLDVVKLLLAKGARVNAQARNEIDLTNHHGGKGRTALQWTLRMTEGARQKGGQYHSEATTVQIINELMAAGADPYVKDCPWQLTALDWALNNKQDDAFNALITGRETQLRTGPRKPEPAKTPCKNSRTGQQLTKQLQNKKTAFKRMAHA